MTTPACLLDRIKARCEVDEETGCWCWNQGTVRGVPNWRRGSDGGRRVRFIVWEETKGETLTPNNRIVAKCGDELCVAPDHLIKTTRSARQKGSRSPRTKVIAIAEKARARSPLDWDKVREIRASSETCVALGKKYNVHFDCISKVRRHLTWREEHNNPFAGLMHERKAA